MINGGGDGKLPSSWEDAIPLPRCGIVFERTGRSKNLERGFGSWQASLLFILVPKNTV